MQVVSGDMIVSVDRVTKTFKDVSALEDISFQIRKNEFVSLVGPSGCGKSTLLRIVAGLISTTGGAVMLRGQTLAGPANDMGMVFQSPVLLPWRTALKNVLFVAEMRGEPAKKHRQRALDLLALAGLTGFEDRLPHELSGGMQQRVAICRSLLLSPSIILMDEPFGALDIITRERMGFELQKIWNVSRTTVLLVTHSITEAVLLSDRILVMSARPGRITEVVDVDLPRPRGRSTLADPKFIRLSTHVSNHVAAGWVE